LGRQTAGEFAFPGTVKVIGKFDSDRRSFAPTMGFFVAKRLLDLAVCLLLLPFFAVFALGLLIVNPFGNAGPLFYVQTRMGRGCKPFRAIKFRSMTVATEVARGAHDPLETDRITAVGKFLRKTRVDELPQILNVFRNEMSLIGPRPDYFEHAKEYIKTVPGYRARHAVKPGISGFAQTEVGYADDEDTVKTKVQADLLYIRNRSTLLECWIFWRTLVTVFGRHGS